MRLNSIIIALLVFLYSCNDNEKIIQIYSYPEWQKEVFLDRMPENSFYLFNLGNPTLSLFPTQELKREDQQKAFPHKMDLGGEVVLKKYLQTLRERLGEKVKVIGYSNLDKQDQQKSNLILKSLKEYQLDALLLSKADLPSKGESENPLKKDLPWFNTNILSITSGDPTDLYQSEPFKVLTPHGLGLIGVTSYQTLSAQERNEISGFYFQDPVTSILRYKNILSKQKDVLITLYYNGELTCNQELPIKPISFEKLPAMSQNCTGGKELFQILKRLPPNAVDLVITGIPSLSGVLYKGKIPVLGAGGAPQYLSGFRITKNSQSLSLKDSLLLPPIKLCHSMFAGTQDCVFKAANEDIDDERYDLMEKSGFGLIPARFLGREIKP